MLESRRHLRLPLAMQVSVMMVKLEGVVLDKSLVLGQDQGLKFCPQGQPRTKAKDNITATDH